jgi:hypothetical protein
MRGLAMIAAVAMMALPGMGLAADDTPSLGWLAGTWQTEAGVAPETSEYWQPAADGGVSGVSTSSQDGKTVSVEKMRILVDHGQLVFRASPNGAAPVDFREASHGATDVAFQNAGHDYPQRIRYWRDGEFLMAEIAMADGSKPVRWKYRQTAQ